MKDLCQEEECACEHIKKKSSQRLQGSKKCVILCECVCNVCEKSSSPDGAPFCYSPTVC